MLILSWEIYPSATLFSDPSFLVLYRHACMEKCFFLDKNEVVWPKIRVLSRKIQKRLVRQKFPMIKPQPTNCSQKPLNKYSLSLIKKDLLVGEHPYIKLYWCCVNVDLKKIVRITARICENSFPMFILASIR
jgi:hypothetical protein